MFKDIPLLAPFRRTFAEKHHVMIKRFFKHITKRYRYWRYRRLLRKLLSKYLKRRDSFESALYEASSEFEWLTGENKPKNCDRIWYFIYL